MRATAKMVMITAAAIPPGVMLGVAVSEDEAAAATGTGVGVATRPGFAQAPAVEFKRPESMMDAVHGGPYMGCREAQKKSSYARPTDKQAKFQAPTCGSAFASCVRERPAL